MKRTGKIFAILLSVMMVFTYMPAMAFAAGEEAGDPNPAEETLGGADASEEGGSAEETGCKRGPVPPAGGWCGEPRQRKGPAHSSQ